ncbi:outer membrane beta-barrel protein [Flavitalea flava]
MRKLLFTLSLSLFYAVIALAQTPAGQGNAAKPGAPGVQGAPKTEGAPKPGGPGGPGGGMAGGPPSIGRAYGKVTDSTGQPMGQVSALVLKASVDPTTKKKKLVLLKGMDTKPNGEFDFEDLPIASPLVLKLSATGYKPQDVSFMIVPASASGVSKPGEGSPLGNLPSFNKDLGSLKLVNDMKELGAVTVTAKTPAMRLDMDKKVFNVDRNIVSAGGTAQDVMRNVPSVNVDIDGNVTLRGSSPTIFVDGRPTTLSLDQIPADAIESVEVMTNPSAKYDASGGGSGILNIILKKNKKQGYNGSISTGMDSHGAPNALAGFNARQGKVNLSLNGMYNGMNGKTVGNTDRFTYLSNTTHLIQDDLQRNKGHFMFGNIGLDYFITNKTTLSAAYIKVHGRFTPTDVSNIETDSLNSSGKQTLFSLRNSNSSREFDVNGVQVGMKHLFAKEGEQITVDGSHFAVTSHSSSLYTTDYYAGQPGPNAIVTSTTRQQTLGTASPAFTTVQTDYTNPFGKAKLEAGLRATFQKLSNYNDTYNLDENGKPTITPYGTSNYTSISRVYAAYVNFSNTIGNFGYSVGLRGESSNYSGDLLNTGQHFHNSYPVTLFPSIFLSEKLKNNQELQVSATRKVNRPGFFQLIPYTDYSDTLNITRGNPNLVPEFTNSFELSYMKTFAHSNTLLVSGYYKYTSNLMTRYQDSALNPDGHPVLINTYENANNAYTVGGEITSTDNITKWWDITVNLNLYNSHINTDNLKQVSQDAIWSWFGKFNSNFKLPSNFSIQLTAIYQSKTNIPANQQANQFGPPGSTTQSSSQGFIRPFYGIDMAVKKSFLKNNAASVTATMTDIFRTRWSKQNSHSAYFLQEYDRLRDPQLFKVVFAYRFGKMDLNLFKRKDMNSQGPPPM